MTGLMGEKTTVQPIVSTANASGGTSESDNVIDTGSASGSVTVNYDMYYVPDSLDIYYGVFGSGGVKIASTNGPVSGTGTITISYGPQGGFSSNFITIVMNQGGGQTGTVWNYNATVNPSAQTLAAGGILKLGSQKLNIQGDGTYTGPDDIQQGVVRLQNDTGLGGSASTTTVEAAQPTVQTIVLGNAVANSTTFQLSLGASQTGQIPYTGTGADATAIQAALNALASVTSQNGSVTVKPQSTSAVISAISETGTTVTVTTATPHGFTTGQQVTIAGVTPLGYDGTFNITVTGANTFTYTAAAGLTAATLNSASASSLIAGAWTVTFGGGLTPFDESLGASVGAGPGNITVTTQRHGGGAALELGLTNPSNAAGICAAACRSTAST